MREMKASVATMVKSEEDLNYINEEASVKYSITTKTKSYQKMGLCEGKEANKY